MGGSYTARTYGLDRSFTELELELETRAQDRRRGRVAIMGRVKGESGRVRTRARITSARPVHVRVQLILRVVQWEGIFIDTPTRKWERSLHTHGHLPFPLFLC